MPVCLGKWERFKDQTLLLKVKLLVMKCKFKVKTEQETHKFTQCNLALVRHAYIHISAIFVIVFFLSLEILLS